MGRKRDMATTSALKTKRNSQVKPDLAKIIPVITQPIIGETCHQISFSYGDELKLDFGEMTPCEHPRLADLLEGSWRLGARATPWIIKHNNQIFISTSELDTDEEIEAGKLIAKQLENKKLLELVVDGETVSLTLGFEDSYQLILEPDLADDSGLAYWELFMPTAQFLAVGPGYFWSCKSIYDPA